MLERARHLESTLDNNVLLQYLDAVLFDQYLCKGEILHQYLIIILSFSRSVGGCQASYLATLVQEGELYRSSCEVNMQLTIMKIIRAG